MRILNKLKHLHVICLKYGDKFFTSLIMLVPEGNASISSTIKGNPISFSRKFPAFVATVIN